MKLLIDMNLSPQWVPLLQEAGWEAVHWSSIGEPSAPDQELFKYALSNCYVILTHDLDFGAILAATRANGPSVVQVRSQDVTPRHLGPLLLSVLQQFQKHLEDGALITVDENRTRARILPF